MELIPTHREYLLMLRWMEYRLEHPTIDQLYQMQIARCASDPKADLDKFRLKFERKATPQEAQLRSRSAWAAVGARKRK